MNEKIVEIYLVDDDTSDRELFSMALKEMSPVYKLKVAGHGEELLRELDRLGAHDPLPNVIFLDLNMPVKDGRETLSQLKAHERYKKIPVFIYTTSSSADEVALCYRAGANLVLNKPFDYDSLVKNLGGLIELFPEFLILP